MNQFVGPFLASLSGHERYTIVGICAKVKDRLQGIFLEQGFAFLVFLEFSFPV